MSFERGVLFVGVVLLMVGLVDAQEVYRKTLNVSSLPFSDNLSINLTTADNTTLLFFSTPFLSHDSLVVFSSINVLNFNVSIMMPNFVGVGNFTEELNVTNNVTNSTSSFQFFFEILNDSVNETNMTGNNVSSAILNGSGLFSIDLTTSGAFVCDKALPWTSNFSILVGGEVNESINVTCDSWVICPPQINISENGFYNLLVNFTVPKDIELGIYRQNVIFDVNSSFDNFSFLFDIRGCPFSQEEILESLKKCSNISNSSDFSEFVDCLGGFAIFFSDLYEKVLKANKTKIVNNTVEVDKNITVYETVYDPDVVNKLIADLISAQGEEVTPKNQSGSSSSSSFNEDNLLNEMQRMIDTQNNGKDVFDWKDYRGKAFAAIVSLFTIYSFYYAQSGVAI